MWMYEVSKLNDSSVDSQTGVLLRSRVPVQTSGFNSSNRPVIITNYQLPKSKQQIVMCQLFTHFKNL
jgi:hypothetical protein